jgi:hypothetical protein
VDCKVTPEVEPGCYSTSLDSAPVDANTIDLEVSNHVPYHAIDLQRNQFYAEGLLSDEELAREIDG